MTREEAVEVILNGPFRRCFLCHGRGATSSGDSCSLCIPESDTKFGSGKVWKDGYLEACALLGLEPPDAIWRAADMDGDEVKL